MQYNELNSFIKYKIVRLIKYRTCSNWNHSCFLAYGLVIMTSGWICSVNRRWILSKETQVNQVLSVHWRSDVIIESKTEILMWKQSNSLSPLALPETIQNVSGISIKVMIEWEDDVKPSFVIAVVGLIYQVRSLSQSFHFQYPALSVHTQKNWDVDGGAVLGDRQREIVIMCMLIWRALGSHHLYLFIAD